MNTTEKKYKRILPVIVFMGGALVYLLAVLPFLISHRGLFFYYGDYNVQQVPFLIFAHRAVREGRFFWNPLVDLGGNMTGTFAFYLWGSPFFWLTIPFPEKWLPYMTPYLMALKFGTAAATSCVWIRTQTRSDKAAVLGAFLYAFSGFQACNIVFQHFHDVTAFFPLYLLTFDRFVRGRRAGRKSFLGFILMTALMSVINYYFFFGQVLFLILYYLVRWGIRRGRADGIAALMKEILQILAAGACGLMLSAFFLVQSIGGILGNTRVEKVLSGYDLVAYPDATTPLAILKTFFMVPDLIARGTLFTSDHIRNGSLGFYLPCFAMAGVFAYWKMYRRSWKKTLLTILAVMAFVPVLCAAFSAFNSNFYVRWFYMPVLICACMTAQAFEDGDRAAFTKGTVLSLACTAFFLACCFLPVKTGSTWSFTAVCENRKLLTTEIEATLFGAFFLVVILVLKRLAGGILAERLCGTLCILLTILCCISSTMAVLHNGSSLISYTGFEKWKRQMLTERPLLGPDPDETGDVPDTAETADVPGPVETADVPDPVETADIPDPVEVADILDPSEAADIPDPAGDPASAQVSGDMEIDGPFSRVETDSTSTNYEMVWGYPTMHCFESTVHPEIFTWYRGIGMIRTVESTLPLERIGARALMSVRYYIENTLVKPDKSYTDQGGIDGYRLLNDEKGYNVYETENYIPMGFCFDSYMTEENYDLLENGTVSDRVLVKNIVLSDRMAEKYGYLFEEEDTDVDPGQMPYWEFTEFCRDRAASACSEFAFETNGYHAVARMERDNLLLFSVPYDRGFSVTIDGEAAELERADFGLSAVFVPEGRHEIRVTYLPVGFVPCAVLSLVTAAGLVILRLVLFLKNARSQ